MSGCGSSTRRSRRRCWPASRPGRTKSSAARRSGLEGAAGRIERDKLNVDGGAIGLGHPVGASGNRIVLHLVNAMKRLGVKQGIATECIGGGQGGAMLIETV
jgi:acetyl-CoA acetyltransferase